MSCNPATGTRVSHYYVAESTCNETPTSPVWTPIRYTSGTLQLTKDAIVSAELNGSREVSDTRLGQNQVSGEIAVELSVGAYTDLLEAATGGTWSSAVTGTGLTVSVNAGTNKFTRASGDFTVDGVKIGDLIQFDGFVNAANNGVFRVSTVSATEIVVYDRKGLLVTESTVSNIDYTTSTKLGVGSTRRTFSILTHYADADDGAGEYHLATGCEIVGYSFDCSVNANVTGTFSVLGRNYTADTALPSGSTFNSLPTAEVFSSMDGIITDAGTVMGLTTSMSFSLDNAASAQFVIGDSYAAFIEQGRANSTLTLNTFFENSDLLNKFINEEESRVSLTLVGASGGMSFYFRRVVYTSGAPEVGGEGSVTASMNAQALNPNNANYTSVMIYNLAV